MECEWFYERYLLLQADGGAICGCKKNDINQVNGHVSFKPSRGGTMNIQKNLPCLIIIISSSALFCLATTVPPEFNLSMEIMSTRRSPRVEPRSLTAE